MTAAENCPTGNMEPTSYPRQGTVDIYKVVIRPRDGLNFRSWTTDKITQAIIATTQLSAAETAQAIISIRQEKSGRRDNMKLRRTWQSPTTRAGVSSPSGPSKGPYNKEHVARYQREKAQQTPPSPPPPLPYTASASQHWPELASYNRENTDPTVPTIPTIL
ncbi:hypothetical protein HPB47_017130 [Ixodes persulcatus]|uniref:Uncharacterized protein n=1 Tax=Ixodes persulcatus TaxID=34615 RepID=A0AC60QP97_IXOPE|nr:hypothetical protein HPB47_017130 [Ixodes persulcatus]